ncbi:MAG TPA: hypothetical protein VJS63_16215 [Bradyrhizobium sp.]|nr:hypothetical protein [Allosphingosinicella sp.]HKS20748.1 hypothetical protein [Bradyrhizobium sp.]
MGYPDQKESLEQALDRIEETILPGISMMLDALLDAATLARRGIDAEIYPEELRRVARQLEALTRQIEAIAPAQFDSKGYRIASAA